MTSSNAETDTRAGAYILIISVPQEFTTRVGALGPLVFRAGGYAYVGSAMNGLQQRVQRHLSDDKKKHWHIDYLLEDAAVADVVTIPSGRRIECELARKLSQLAASVPGFGASDCDCSSHLFYEPDVVQLREMVDEAVSHLRASKC
ncbi:MAG: GIY-YIG nuclease family protein [Armatimonadota bacterium]